MSHPLSYYWDNYIHLRTVEGGIGYKYKGEDCPICKYGSLFKSKDDRDEEMRCDNCSALIIETPTTNP